MMANCSSCCGGRLGVGAQVEHLRVAVRGRDRRDDGGTLDPGRRSSARSAPWPCSAPVLPALTAALARPSCTRSMATRMEESFLRRIASRGFSSMLDHLGGGDALRARAHGGRQVSAAWASMQLAARRTSTAQIRIVRAARAARRRRTRAARESPLITSIAIGSTQALQVRRADGLAEGLFLVVALGRLLDHALAAIEAIRGDAVTQVRLTRLRIDRQRGLASARRASGACRGATASCGFFERAWYQLLNRIRIT